MTATATPLTLDARASRAWARRFARTTPGLVVLIAVAVAALCIVAGVVSAAAINGRIAEQKAVLDHSEPFAYAAQNLYAASSAADAAAATAFLSGGNQTPLMRARYQQALASAASALADATAGAPDAETRKALAEVSAQLATYTGLVEAARANNAQGFPIGSAYLREASSSMQTKLLPGAEKVYAADLARVEQAQRRVGSLPMVGLALLVVALAAIGIGSAIMFKRTNRRFNLGLVAAAVVVVLMMLWIVGAVRLAAGDIERGRTEGTARFGQLAEARILAQQARTDETLQLITRGDITASEKSFYGHIDELKARIGTASPEAAQAVDKWAASHRCRWTPTGPATTRPRSRRRSAPTPAHRARSSVPSRQACATRSNAPEQRCAITCRTPVAISCGCRRERSCLMTGAAVAAVVGLWPRLKEFL